MWKCPTVSADIWCVEKFLVLILYSSRRRLSQHSSGFFQFIPANGTSVKCASNAFVICARSAFHERSRRQQYNSFGQFARRKTKKKLSATAAAVAKLLCTKPSTYHVMCAVLPCVSCASTHWANQWKSELSPAIRFNLIVRHNSYLHLYSITFCTGMRLVHSSIDECFVDQTLRCREAFRSFLGRCHLVERAAVPLDIRREPSRSIALHFTRHFRMEYSPAMLKCLYQFFFRIDELEHTWVCHTQNEIWNNAIDSFPIYGDMHGYEISRRKSSKYIAKPCDVVCSPVYLNFD